MRTQKELKDQYKEYVLKVEHSPSIQKYCIQNCGYLVELSNGKIVVLDKPQIETRFCFGYGWCGSDRENDEDRADALYQKATTDPNFFLKENMVRINDEIFRLVDAAHHPDNRCTIRKSDKPFVRYGIRSWIDLTDEFEVLREDDINKIIAGLEEVKKAFDKRLHTYLKRYGLSKINAWTYLRD